MKLLVFLSMICTVAVCIDLSGRNDIQRRTIAEGETLRLICRATPAHLRSYRWVYIREDTTRPRVISSGRRLTVAEPRFSLQAQKRGEYIELTLELKEVRPYETGIFMCWKQNHKPDPQVYVKVLEQGFTEEQPASVEISGPTHASYGSSVSIKCLIRPAFPGMVTWLKNGHEIPSDDNSYTQNVQERTQGKMIALLTIVTSRADANYTCKSPSYPRAEASFHLIVRVANVELLIAEPSTTKIEYGQTLSLTCVVSGTDHEIVWMKDGSFLSLDENHSVIYTDDKIVGQGKQQSVLVVQSFSMGNNGQYACYVPGASKDISINIESRSPRLIGVESWDFLNGDVLRLSCSTQYAKLNKEVTWLFEGLPFDDSWWAEQTLREDDHNITYNDLEFPRASTNFAGTYTCVTPFGKASSIVHEIVRPYVDESPPAQVEVLQGELLSLPCSVRGYPVPMVFWEKLIENQWKMVEETNAEGLEETQGIQITTTPLRDANDEKVVGERQELMLIETLPKHAGQYQCRGANDKDTIIVTTDVTILEPRPVVLSITADPVTEGEDLIITCTIGNAKQPVDFVHGLSLIDISRDERFDISVFEEPDPFAFDSEMSYSNVTTFVLTVTNSNVLDRGLYECHADDEEFDFINAVVQLPPPKIVEIAASPAFEETELFISCTIMNAVLDEEVIFSFGDVNLNHSSDPRYSVHMAEVVDEREFDGFQSAKQATYVLKIKRVRLEDSGTYFCAMITDNSETIESVNVEIEAKEHVEEDVELYVETGIDILLICKVTNWDSEISFYHNATLLLEYEDSRFTPAQNITDDNIIIHSLLIKNAVPEDAGRYQCFTSPYIYDDVNITVDDLDLPRPPVDISMPPIVIMQMPFPDVIETDSIFVLQCETQKHSENIEFVHREHVFSLSSMSSEPESRITVFDLQDNERYENNSAAGLRIAVDKVELEDGGYWTCRTTESQTGTIYETSLQIDIYEAPVFTTTPEELNIVAEGSDVSLDCIASGYPDPTVVWYKQDNALPIVNSTLWANLMIRNISIKDEGTYSCEAITDRDIKRFLTTIQISRSLDIIEFPEPRIIVTDNSDIELNCIAVGSATPQVTWYKKDNEFTILSVGEDYASLIIKEVTDNDAGIYTCEANIPGSVTRKDTELILARKTSVLPTTSPSPTLLLGRLVDLSGPRAVETGGEVTLTCLVSPLLNYYDVQILHDDDILVDEQKGVVSLNTERITVVMGKGGVGERLLKVTIPDINYSDSGFYECRINSDPRALHNIYVDVVPEGQLTTKATTIPQSTSKDTLPTFTAHHEIPETDRATVILEDSSQRSLRLGSSVEIPCTIESASQKDVSWIHKTESGETILFNDGLRLTENSRHNLEIIVDDTSSHISQIFEIIDIIEDDFGTYICRVNQEVEMSTTLIPAFSEEHLPGRDIAETLDEKIEDEIRAINNDVDSSISIEETETKYQGSLDVYPEENDFLTEDFSVEEHHDSSEEEIDVSYSDELDRIDEVLVEYQDYSPDLTAKSEIDHNTVLPADEHPTVNSELEEYDFGSHENDRTNISKNTNEEGHNLDHDDTDLSDTEDLYNQSHGTDLEENGSKTDTKFDPTSKIITTTENPQEDIHIPKDYGESAYIVEEWLNSHQPRVNHSEHGITEQKAEATTLFYDYEYSWDTTTQKSQEITLEVLTTPGDILTDATTISFTTPVSSTFESLITSTVTTSAPPLTTTSTTSTVPTVNAVDSTDTTAFSVSTTGITTVGVSSETTEKGTQTTLDTTMQQWTSPNVYVTSEHTSIEITEDPASAFVPLQEIDSTTKQSRTALTTDTADGIVKEADWVPEGNLEYNYDNLTPVPEKEESYEYPIITGVPGEDILAPIEAIVILPCPTEATPEDITWKSEDQLLFLGSLDLAGVVGLQLSVEGNLRLLPGNIEVKERTYTCFIYDYMNYKDVPVMSYKVDLDKQYAMSGVVHELDFPGVDWENVAVVSNTNLSARGLSAAFEVYGTQPKVINSVDCVSDEVISGWGQAKEFIKNYCEPKLLGMKEYKDVSIFFLLDFLVKLPYGASYGSSLLHVNNLPAKLSTHVFGPLVPVYSGQTPSRIQCGTPMYEGSEEASLDYCTNLAATLIITLQESYKLQQTLE